jgi:hypothetical protein
MTHIAIQEKLDGGRRVAGKGHRRPISQVTSDEELKERTMPHVIVKMYSTRSKQQKTQLTEAIVKEVMAIAKIGEEAVLVATATHPIIKITALPEYLWYSPDAYLGKRRQQFGFPWS